MKLRLRTVFVFGLLTACVASGQSTGARRQPRNSGASEVPGHGVDIRRYSPYAAAGGYSRHRETFWEFWFHRFNPRNLNYGTWFEGRRRVFLEQAGANPYFWFSFWELAAVCFLLLWIAKERIDRKDTEWEAAACMADLTNYATYCRRQAAEAIRVHNEHIEVCNRVIESTETGRPVTPAGNEEEWKKQLNELRTELGDKAAEIGRLRAELAKAENLADLAARVDELARNQSAGANGGGTNANLDLVARVNRLTAELQAARDENSRLKRANTHADSGERTR